MPSMEGGGVEKNLVILINFLSNKYKNIKIISFDELYKKKISKKISFISFKKKPIIINKYFKYFICLILLFKEIIFKDVLVLSFQANIYCLIVCKLLNKKIIVRSNSSPSGWTKNLFKNIIYSFFIKKCDTIIVNSHYFKKEMKKKFNVNTSVIYNPLNIKEIKKNSKEKLNKKFYKKKYLNIINVGRLTDQKDHLTLLKAVKVLTKNIKINLLIIGYGRNKKNLISFIKKNKIEDRVRIINELNNPYKFILRFDLFILTSKYEGLPNVLLESLALKTPIISTDCPSGPREILENNKFGTLFDIGDYKKLSNLISNYKTQRRNFIRKANLGYNSLHRFDYKQNCLKYFREIEKLN